MPFMSVLDLKTHSGICKPSRRFSQGRSTHVFRPACVYPDHGLHAIENLSTLCGEVPSNFSVKSFTCMDQFRTIAFAQLTYRESLRDIEACSGRKTTNSITWTSAAKSLTAPWRRRTRYGTGVSTPILPII